MIDKKALYEKIMRTVSRCINESEAVAMPDELFNMMMKGLSKVRIYTSAGDFDGYQESEGDEAYSKPYWFSFGYSYNGVLNPGYAAPLCQNHDDPRFSDSGDPGDAWADVTPDDSVAVYREDTDEEIIYKLSAEQIEILGDALSNNAVIEYDPDLEFIGDIEAYDKWREKHW